MNAFMSFRNTNRKSIYTERQLRIRKKKLGVRKRIDMREANKNRISRKTEKNNSM